MANADQGSLGTSVVQMKGDLRPSTAPSAGNHSFARPRSVVKQDHPAGRKAIKKGFGGTAHMRMHRPGGAVDNQQVDLARQRIKLIPMAGPAHRCRTEWGVTDVCLHIILTEPFCRRSDKSGVLVKTD